jgi:pimeloyl-ACP methyl ester carboxylesterase
MKRRQFLRMAGGGALFLALGASVVDQERPQAWRQAERWLGVAPSGGTGSKLRSPPVRATLVRGSFASRYMRGEVAYAYSLPSSGRPEAIVLSLYGKGGDELSAFDGLRLPAAAEVVGAPLCIASANGGPDCYWHARANGTDAHAMVVEELLPLIRKRLGHLPVTVQGFSMGGYGALLAAEKAPSLFRAVAAGSPALWTEPGLTAPGAFDSPADFYANDVFTSVDALRHAQLRLDCGDEDPFYVATRQLSTEITWPHVAEFWPGAAHTMSFWRAVAPAQMRFLWRAVR